jgi:hypothetical protein
MTFCSFAVARRGSFTRAGATQAVLSFDNCQDADSDAAWNGSMSGSAVVVEEVGGRFRVVTWEAGVDIGRCKSIRRPDGRDVLVCRSRYDAGNIGTMHYFFLLDFTRTQKRAGTFAWLYDETDSFVCQAHAIGGALAPTGLVGLHVANVTFDDLNHDGVADVVVDVARARAAPSPALETRLHALCKNKGKAELALPAATHTRLEMLSNGDGFAPAPASQKLLDAWEAESPDVVQLRGVAPPKLE